MRGVHPDRTAHRGTFSEPVQFPRRPIRLAKLIGHRAKSRLGRWANGTGRVNLSGFFVDATEDRQNRIRTETANMYDANVHQQLLEVRQSIENLARRVEFLYEHLGVREPDNGVPAYVRDATRLVRENRVNEAVRLIVEHTAVGLAEARAMVEDLALRARTGTRTSGQAMAATRAPTSSEAPTAPRRDYDVVGPAASRH